MPNLEKISEQQAWDLAERFKLEFGFRCMKEQMSRNRRNSLVTVLFLEHQNHKR